MILLAAVLTIYVGAGVFALDEICVPTCGYDRSLFMWMFAWMERAVLSGTNPFFSTVIGTPTGTSLYWMTTVPAQTILAIPFTFLFGAQAAHNIAVIFGLAFSAWAVYLLCMEVVGRFWPSVAGGLLFLLSPYMAKEANHMNLLFVAPVVLIVRATLRYGAGTTSRRSYILVVAGWLFVEFFTSVEVFATTALFGAIAIAMHLLFLPRADRRSVAQSLLAGLAGAYALCAAAVSPVLLTMWSTRPDALAWDLSERSVELLEWVIPSSNTMLGALTTDLRAWLGIESVGPTAGVQGYIGLPVIIFLLAAWRWRERYPKMLLPFISVAMLFSLGPRIVLFRDLSVPGPYALLSWLPLLEHAWPVRFPLYAWIAISVLFSLWLARRPAVRSGQMFGVVAIGLLFLMPSVALFSPSGQFWPLYRPAFFSTDAHRWFLQEDDVVLVLTRVGTELEWQVESDFGFRLAEGYLGGYAPWGNPPLNFNSPPPAGEAELIDLVERLDLDWVVLPTGYPNPWRSLLERYTGVPPVSLGEIDLYRVSSVARDDPVGPSVAGQAAYQRGLDALRRGDDAAAYESFAAVLEDSPMDPLAHLQLALIGLSHDGKGSGDLVVAHLRAALLADPDLVPAMVELARIWSEEGLDAEAESLYRRALELEPSSLTSEDRAKFEQQGPTTVNP